MGRESQYEESSDRNSGGSRGRGAGMVAAAALLLLLGGGVGFGLGSGFIPGSGTESAVTSDNGDSAQETAEEAGEKSAALPQEEAPSEQEAPAAAEEPEEETEPAGETAEASAEEAEENAGSGDAGDGNPGGESTVYSDASEELAENPAEGAGEEDEPEEAAEEPEEIPDVIVVRISGNEVTVNGHPAENSEELKSRVGEYADGVRTFELEENRAILETYRWVVEAFDEMEIYLKEAD